jgi:lipopolysaccharide transport system ATP-binding protein
MDNVSIAIQVDSLYKQYRLGMVTTGTISHDLNRWWYKIRGKEDPYLKITSINDRTDSSSRDYVWALNDINFQVKKGEVLGIIGKNGAGKSTLLKILSKVTSPTKGSIKISGRIASLLEVGTGFHPELSGRENIYLNGAILGMSKCEIKGKLDEIVDFSGVDKYIDTPVKRYSSGMYVRLAFAVAAHLESEILIIDEVLAVGDAEFQKKCLGKMKDVSLGQGRTVLFVSHNMSAVETLCNHCISLKNGRFLESGNPQLVVKNYLKDTSTDSRIISFSNFEDAIGNNSVRILSASINNAETPDSTAIIDVTNDVDISFTILNLTQENVISVGFDLKTVKGDTLFGTGGKFECVTGKPTKLICRIPGNFLNDELYQIHLYIHTEAMRGLYSNTELMTFEVKDIQRESGYLGKINGLIRPKLNWTIGNE